MDAPDLAFEEVYLLSGGLEKPFFLEHVEDVAVLAAEDVVDDIFPVSEEVHKIVGQMVYLARSYAFSANGLFEDLFHLVHGHYLIDKLIVPGFEVTCRIINEIIIFYRSHE